MKTIVTKILLSLSILLLFNCEQTTKIDYKYADKEFPLECNDSGISKDLLKEALYSFEEDILKFPYQNPQLPMAYSKLSSFMNSKRDLPKSKIAEHTLKVADLLKKEKHLWIIDKDGKHSLNYNHPIINCIGDHIKDQNLKTTFNALLTTNSMSDNLITAPIRSKLRTAPTDKALATFIALNTFYPRLLDMDFSEKKPEDTAK